MTTNNIFQKDFYLADGGLETTLIYHQGLKLNHFAAFELLTHEQGKEEMAKYYVPYLDLAEKKGLNFILETPTWRANPDWAYKLGYSNDELNAINRNAVTFLRSLLASHTIDSSKVVLSGCVGPRGDGYIAGDCMTPAEAKAYHFEQIQAFALADADITSAITMTYSDEALGIALAARELHIPAVISFTVETDGRLPNGETLKSAIEKVDAELDGYPEHYMINCAHPEHFIHVLEEKGNWKSRIRGVRANASTKSHAELDASDTLDTGDKSRLTEGYRKLSTLLPNLIVLGGCCGTDHTHLQVICEATVSGQDKTQKVEASK
ncbi:homocysteine S-methyltransferase family protein [Aliifodinibius sp. S!AR15-10]|uniref:homocysteine S-methyltransferase family protein n=1 Tax=Aliifodinibius sp. S!AR15-10 TaxID=2950437 RepID=UPI0028583F85|nr:homocysteine S-methyltransferase family protein [Aliifodinibius sp. S!AR15-10]MDR8392628.1 homocysteine S-methyltransferase family protein [Aliifodinibius sp. S!AR15-10]